MQCAIRADGQRFESYRDHLKRKSLEFNLLSSFFMPTYFERLWVDQMEMATD